VAASGDQPKVDLYGATYGHFAEEIYAEIRREASGEDVGQNSWVTTEELDRFARDLALGPDARLLDVACGSGGPTLHLVRTTGCTAVGVDVHDDAVETAGRLAAEAGLVDRATFQSADAAAPLPFEDGSFDALLCVDAINHLANRLSVLREWNRLLRPGGRMGFTDPITVTGILASDEIAIRASAGYYLFTPAGEDKRLLAEAGLHLIRSEDASPNMAAVAARRHGARARREEALRGIEGDETFEGQQRFLSVTARIALEGRLSRFIFVAEKPEV
jgi:ubiquinone/menaquinone biosynthesis C-methylase UbiE